MYLVIITINYVVWLCILDAKYPPSGIESVDPPTLLAYWSPYRNAEQFHAVYMFLVQSALCFFFVFFLMST